MAHFSICRMEIVTGGRKIEPPSENDRSNVYFQLPPPTLVLTSADMHRLRAARGLLKFLNRAPSLPLELKRPILRPLKSFGGRENSFIPLSDSFASLLPSSPVLLRPFSLIIGFAFPIFLHLFPFEILLLLLFYFPRETLPFHFLSRFHSNSFFFSSAAVSSFESQTRPNETEST